MTSTRSLDPEQLRTELNLAVAPLDPSPRSFNWLQDNVARRRRQRLFGGTAAAGAALSLGVAALVFVSGTAADRRQPTGTPTEGAGVVKPGVDGDVDGDGIVDRVTMLAGAGDAGSATMRVRAVLSGGGAVEADSGLTRTTEQFIDGVVDIDGDGRAEVVVAMEHAGGIAHFTVVRLVSGKFAFASRDVDEPVGFAVGTSRVDGNNDTSAWACIDADPALPGREIITRSVHWGGSEESIVDGGLSLRREDHSAVPLAEDAVDRVVDAVLPLLQGMPADEPPLSATVSCGSLDGRP